MKGQAERVARKTKEGGNVQNGGEVEKMPFFFKCRYCFDGCLAEAPKAVSA